VLVACNFNPKEIVMRYLSEFEGALVSGGDTTVSEVVVIGTRNLLLGSSSAGATYYTDNYAAQIAAISYGNYMTYYYTSSYYAQAYADTHVHNNSASTDPAVLQAFTDLKNQVRQVYQQLMLDNLGLGNGASTRLPGGSMVSPGSALSILDHMDFNIVDTGYGSARAGENVTDSAGHITVNINAGQLAQYDQLAGGINYFILHEIGHDTPAGIASTNSNWAAYLGEPGIGTMTYANQLANYVNSTEFRANEAWANTAAQDMAQTWGITFIGVTPTYGYAPN
jgi:hypothetical protein